MGLSELLTSKNLLIAGLVVGLICLVILLALAGSGKGLNFLPAVTLVGVAALNLASVAYLAPPAPKTAPATTTGQYEPEEDPTEESVPPTTVMGQYEPVKQG